VTKFGLDTPQAWAQLEKLDVNRGDLGNSIRTWRAVSADLPAFLLGTFSTLGASPCPPSGWSWY
jgi:hypothetical protein